ncbi:MAG: 1-(5-phosphoribosyl)-5-[(5-phosphoribosylamino)methylideneamino]imidazole-4-carboxamide isomerase [Anaerolineae bacterium]
MIVYPAIDLRRGRCVRLQQGSTDAEIVFADDPVDAAQRWAAEGTQWLHVVNLDGALGEGGRENLRALERILAAVTVPVQFGGGLRSASDALRLLELGVSRVVLGTVAVSQPEVVVETLMRVSPDQVAVGIDARLGRVAIHGWRDVTDMPAVTLGRRMARLGVERLIYTDVARDGMLTGVNLEDTRDMARETGLSIIASGGVASIEDITALMAHRNEGIDGVIIGMALYRGTIDLRQALKVAGGAEDAG